MRAAEFLQQDAHLRQARRGAAVCLRQAHAEVTRFAHHIPGFTRNLAAAVDHACQWFQFTLGKAAHLGAQFFEFRGQFDFHVDSLTVRAVVRIAAIPARHSSASWNPVRHVMRSIKFRPFGPDNDLGSSFRDWNDGVSVSAG